MTRSIADLQSPPGLPLLGNAHQVRLSELHSTAERWNESYGPMFRFDIGPRRIVVVSDLEEINGALRDRPDGFRRWRDLEVDVKDTGFIGVFLAEGEEWKRQRRLIVTALNSNRLQRYFHVVRTATERLHRRLSEEARGGEAFDVTRLLTSFTVDVTSALAFGHDLNTLERGDNELQTHIQRVFETTGARLGKPVPYWRWVKLPADRAYERSLEVIRSSVKEFIEQARRRMAARPELREEPENFLESMLAAQQLDGAFSDDEIIGNTFTLLLAGEDTTAHTMAWTAWCLAGRPEIQERWAQEARDVLGERLFPEGYESIEQLRYGEGVLREAMRLRPVAPVIGLEPLRDAQMCDTHVPAGTRLLFLMRRASQRSGAFERAGEFEPQRWLDDAEGAARDPKAFLAFGGGPRFCPGRNLAFLEAKCALAMIARNFQIELDEAGGSPQESFLFTMVPKGLRLRLRERAAESLWSAGSTAVPAA